MADVPDSRKLLELSIRIAADALGYDLIVLVDRHPIDCPCGHPEPIRQFQAYTADPNDVGISDEVLAQTLLTMARGLTKTEEAGA